MSSIPIRWTHPKPETVDGFRFFVAVPGTPSLKSGDLGLPTPDGEGIYHATLSVPSVPVAVGVAAYNEAGPSFMSSVRLLPEPGSLGLIAGLVMLALMKGRKNGHE